MDSGGGMLGVDSRTCSGVRLRCGGGWGSGTGTDAGAVWGGGATRGELSGGHGGVPTPAESEAVRKRMSELAWEINQLDGQMAGLAPEEAVVLQRERDEKMREYEAGETELYAMGAIPTEEELREVMGLGQESESGISFRSLPNFSSISQVYLVTHMQCRMTYRGISYDVINYTVDERPGYATPLRRNATISMMDKETSSSSDPIFKLIVGKGAGYVTSVLTGGNPIAEKTVSFLASKAVQLLMGMGPQELSYSRMGTYSISILGSTLMRYVYVKESGKDYVLANSVSSTHITEGHDLYWYTGTGQKHDKEHILLNYYIAGDFQNSTAAWDALEVYDYHRQRNTSVQPFMQYPVSITYTTQSGKQYKYMPYFAAYPSDLLSDY